MDKAIIKLIVAMTIIVAYPSYSSFIFDPAVDYKYCSKLLEHNEMAMRALSESIADESRYIKVPPTLCKEEKIKEEVNKCEDKWKEMYLLNTQKPKGSAFNEGSMLFYSNKSKYWNEVLININTQYRNNKCP